MASKLIARRAARCANCLVQPPAISSRATLALPIRHNTTSTLTTQPAPSDLPPSLANTNPGSHDAKTSSLRSPPKLHRSRTGQYNPDRAPQEPEFGQIPMGPVSSHLKEMLPVLAAQSPHYITVHIHGKPYLVTAGDTVRLPFLMHGVAPGDVLRLNRASVLGSRDFVLRGGAVPGAAGTVSKEVTGEVYTSATVLAKDAQPIVGRTDGEQDTPYPGSSNPQKPEVGRTARLQKMGASAYIDERLFECRATVLGSESEPMRITVKKKQRNRHKRQIKSKHRFTILKISEVKVCDVDKVVSV